MLNVRQHVSATATATALALFFAVLLCVIARRPSMFIKRHGRRHRIAGAVYLMLLIIGVTQLLVHSSVVMLHPFMFDALLGVAGVALALTAAADFEAAHSRVKNVASGALEQHATVSTGEMLEHSFYQVVNLVQIMYLHAVAQERRQWARLVMLAVVTSPWLARGMFPVNKFSDNYTKSGAASPKVRLMSTYVHTFRSC